MTEPRAYTPDELRDRLLEQIKVSARFWAGLPDMDHTQLSPRTIESRLDGLAFSILVALDGGTDLPAFDLVARPHADDKEYLRSQGENWIEDGTTISDTLHERYVALGKAG